MSPVEYMVKIGGDISGLEKAIKTAQGECNRLADDEVAIKLNYDGNIKDFNKTFKTILDACPELTIQFQYDVNKKILDEQLSRLKKIEDLKVEIDTGEAQKRIHNMISDLKMGFESATPLSKGELKSNVQELFRYLNTVNKAGLHIDKNTVIESLSEIDGYLDGFISEQKNKHLELFKIDENLDSDLRRVREQVEEIKNAMQDAKLHGAVDKGEAGDLQVLKDDIKIINMHMQEMRAQMDNLSGEAFQKMAEDVEGLNQRLNETLDKIARIENPNGTSLGQMANEWSKRGIANKERYTAFNSQTLQVVDKDLEGEANNVSESLFRAVINRAKFAVDGFIHSHPENYAAFSDDDLEVFFKLATDGIMHEVTMAAKDVMSIDMSSINRGKEDEILTAVKNAYEQVDAELEESLIGQYIPQLQSDLNTVFSHIDAPQAIQGMVQSFREHYEAFLKTIGDTTTAGEYFDGMEAAIRETLAESSLYQNGSNDIRKTLRQNLVNLTPLLGDSVNSMLKDQLQLRYQDVLQEVFSNPAFLKEGVTSAIKVESLSDFINFNSIREAAENSVKEAKDATKKAQDSASPSQEAHELGVNWGQGYADGIASTDDIVRTASAKLVDAARDGITQTQGQIASSLGEDFGKQYADGLSGQAGIINTESTPIDNQGERASLEQLASLVTNITAAVEEKTQAFHQEDMIVSAAVQSEIDKLSALLDTLHQVTGIIGEIKLPGGEKLKWTDDLQKLDFDKIQNITSSLQTMYQAISKLDLRDSNLVTSIERILSKGDELKNLAKILSESKKKINEATKGGDQKKDITKDKKATYDKELKMQKEILKLEHEINLAEVNGSDKYSEIAAKNRPLIEMLNEEIKKNNEKRKQQNLTSQEFRQNINAEIREINRRNEAEIKGIRASVEERKRQSSQNEVVGNIDGQISELSKLQKQLNNVLNTKNDKLMQPYKNEALKQLDKLQQRIGELEKVKIDIIDGKEIQDLSEANEVTQKLVNETNQIKASATDSINKIAKDIKIASLSEEMTDFLTKNTKLSKEFRIEIENLRSRLNSGTISSQGLQDIASAFERIKEQAKQAGDVGKSFFDIFKDRLTGVNAQFLTTYFSLQDWIRYGREAFQTINELDYALVDLRKTTTMSTADLEEFYYSASDVGKRMGTTTEQIISQAAQWSRLGYSSKEAATQMAALSSQFAAISPGMSLDQATDGLVSTMQAFHISVEDSERAILDNVNRIGNTFATSNEEIMEMLKRSSAAMKAANNTIEETIALESAAVQITRNAETTGTAFRTISMRIRGFDEETEELSEDLENISGDIADLTKTAKSPGGISIFTDKTRETYKSTYQILKDISEIWNDLTDKQQAGLLEKIGGKRGAQSIADLLSDFSEVERAMKEMGVAAGSADDEMTIAADSLKYKMNELQQTWVGIIQEIGDRKAIGGIIDMLTKLSEAFGDLVTSGAGLPMLIGNIGSAIYTIRKKGDISGLFGITPQSFAASIKNVWTKIRYEDIIPDANLVENLYKDLLGGGNIDDLAKKYNVSAKALHSFMEATDAATRSQDGLQNALTTTTKRTAGQIVKTGALTAAEKIATVATKALTFALQALAMAAAAFIVSKIIQSIIEYEHRVENARDSLKDCKSAIDDINSTLEENTKLLNDAKERYVELSEGVDKYGRNLSLSEEEYKEFVELNKQLADKFPELITGYNSSGDAILYIGDSAEEAAEKLQKMIEKEERLANIEIANTLPTSLKDSLTLYSADKSNINELETLEDYYNALFDNIVENKSAFYVEGHGKATKLVEDILSQIPIIGDKITDTFFAEHSYDMVQDFKAAFNDFLETIPDEDRKKQFKDAIDVDDSLFFSAFSGNLSKIEFTEKEASDFADAYTRVLNSALAGFSYQKDELYNEIEKAWRDAAIPGIEAQMKLLPSYDALSDNGKELASTLLHNLSSSVIKEMDSSGDNAFSQTEVISWVSDNLLEPISEIGEYKSLNIMTKILEFDQKTADKNSLEYVNYVNDLITEIQSVADLDENRIKLLLGIDIDKSVKDIPGDLDSQITKNMQKNNASLFDPAIIGMADKKKVAKWGETEWKYYKRAFGDAYDSKKFEDHSVDSLNKAAAEAVKQTIARYENTGLTNEFTKLFSKRTNREGAKTGSFDDVLTNELKAQNDEISQLNAELGELAEERKVKEAELLGYENNLEQNKSSLNSAKEELKDIDAQLTALEDARLQIQSTEDAIVADREDYNKRLEAAKGDVAQAEAKVEAAQAGQTDIGGLQKEQAANAEAIAQAEEDVARLEELNNKLALLRKEEAEGQVVPVDTEAMRIRDEAQAELDSINEEREQVNAAQKEYHEQYIAEEEAFLAEKDRLYNEKEAARSSWETEKKKVKSSSETAAAEKQSLNDELAYKKSGRESLYEIEQGYIKEQEELAKRKEELQKKAIKDAEAVTAAEQKVNQAKEDAKTTFGFTRVSEEENWDKYNELDKQVADARAASKQYNDQIDLINKKLRELLSEYNDVYEVYKTATGETWKNARDRLDEIEKEQLSLHRRNSQAYANKQAADKKESELTDQRDAAKPNASIKGTLNSDVNESPRVLEAERQKEEADKNLDATLKEIDKINEEEARLTSSIKQIRDTQSENETTIASIEEKLANIGVDQSWVDEVNKMGQDATALSRQYYTYVNGHKNVKEDTSQFDAQRAELDKREAYEQARLDEANARLAQQPEKPRTDIAAQIQAVLDEIDELGDASGRLEAYKKAGEAIENQLETASEELVAIGEAEAELQEKQANFEAILEEGALIGDTTSTQEALAQNQAAQDELIARKGEVEQTISNLEAQQGEVNAQIRLTTEAIAGLSQQESELKSKMENLITTVNGYDSALIEIRHRYDEIPEGKEIVDDLVEIAKAGDLDADALRNYERFNELLEILGENADISSDKVQELVDTVNHYAGVNLDQKTFAEQINELDALQSAYEKFRQNVENKEVRINLDSSEIEGLREKFGSLKTEGGMDFDEFELIVGSQTSSAAEIQAAFDGMLTAYAQQKIALDELSDSNAAYVQTQLEMEGATSASAAAFVQAALLRANATRIAADEGYHLEEVTWADIEALVTANLISQEAAEELALLALQKQIVAEEALNEEGNIDQLYALANAAGVATGALDLLAEAKSLASGSVAGLSDDDVNTRLDEIKRTLGDFSAFKSGHTLDFSKDLKKTAGGAGKAADKADELKDALSEISKEIDDIQDAYEKLGKIQETYNQYGHITIDQAQELANMDLKYVTMLTREGDAMSTNTDVFKAMTQAKIKELQVALIRKTMDLIETFKDEAVAAKWYAEALGLAAEEGLNLLSVMAKIQELNFEGVRLDASNLAFDNLSKLLEYIGDVDFELNLEGGEGRGEGEEKEKEEKKKRKYADPDEDLEAYLNEEIEHRYVDFIERALNKVTDAIDKWANRVEQMSEWWNKNWAINKEIEQTQIQIDQQIKAAKLYEQQAVKAAQEAGWFVDFDEDGLFINGTHDLEREWIDKIKNGALEVEMFTGHEEDDVTYQKIQAFIEW